MTAAPLRHPATARDLGHPIAYPLKVGYVWRSTCTKHPEHWMVEIEPPADVIPPR